MIRNRFDLGQYMTFESSKTLPIYDWFWYKEGYAPQIVEPIIRKKGLVLDPFCGVGTTLLCSKKLGINSIGVDASPLAVFVSQTKTDYYEKEIIDEIIQFIKNPLEPRSIDWEFELFDIKKAFPKRNFNEILSIRESLEKCSQKARNLLLLALLSIIPQASLIQKDGGVLKIKNDKKALPAKEIFRRRVKKILFDLSSYNSPDAIPKVTLGDARALEIDDETIDISVNSPPYLNNIDYSKVYGIELSLLQMNPKDAMNTRSRSIRSFIGLKSDDEYIPPELDEVGLNLPIVRTYFADMEKSISELYRVLKPKGEVHMIVANSVIHQTHIVVDELLALIAKRIGFTETEILVGAERIADVKPQKIKVRESVVIMRKK